MKKSPARLPARRMSVENLEGRAMMATASVAGGMLFINGNDAAETVTVTQAVDGRVVVTGVNGGTQTLGPISGITADMRGGNDTLSIGLPNAPLPLLSGANIRLGNGSDVANIAVLSPGAVVVDGGFQTTGVQNDAVTFDSSFLGTAVVNTYAGNDTLAIVRSGIGSLGANLGVETLTSGQTDLDAVGIDASVIGSAGVTLGAGGTTAGAFENTFRSSSSLYNGLSVVGGGARDQVIVNSAGVGIGTTLGAQLVNSAQALEPLLAQARNTLPVDQVFNNIGDLLGDLPSVGGIDFNALLSGIDPAGDLSNQVAARLTAINLTPVGDITVVNNLNIVTLAGNDEVRVTGSNVLGSASIATNAGNDTVLLTNSTFGNTVVAALGVGNDTLAVTNVASNYAVFDGGPGTDTVTVTASPQLGRKLRQIVNFE